MQKSLIQSESEREARKEIVQQNRMKSIMTQNSTVVRVMQI
jgi:hypothetical protein